MYDYFDINIFGSVYIHMIHCTLKKCVMICDIGEIIEKK